jgi:hypothetical protein
MGKDPPVRDVLDCHLWSIAVEENTFEELNTKDTEDDEEGATDEDYIANGFEA